MSKTNKQQSPDKNKEQTHSPAPRALLDVLTKNSSGWAGHAVLSHEEMIAKLTDAPSRKKNLFLGNGFNLAMGVDTSYAYLRDALLDHDTVGKLFANRYPELHKKIKANAGKTEGIISRIGRKDKYHCAFVKEIFYDKILYQAGGKYKRKAVAEFLYHFEQFFTTNYDPLLYLLLLSMEGEEPEQDALYDKIQQIHDGSVQPEGEDEDTPLDEGSNILLRDISTYAIKENYVPKQRDHILRIIRHIRKEPFIHIRDGFVSGESQGGDLEWSPLLAEELKYSNLFYLHGSTFFYKQKETIKKMVSDRRNRFIKILAISGKPMCVFAAGSKGKMKQIKGNRYLEHCQQRLREIKDDLCIVGWSCQKCDDHLIACINENKEITRLLISCYGKSDGERMKIANEYKKIFKDKETIFWDVSTAPFYKELRKKKTSKK